MLNQDQLKTLYVFNALREAVNLKTELTLTPDQIRTVLAYTDSLEMTQSVLSSQIDRIKSEVTVAEDYLKGE